MIDRVRTIRVLVRRGVFTIASLATIVALLLLFFSLEPGERIIKGLLETRISDLLGRRVVIGKLETNLFSRLQIEGVSIAGGGDRDRFFELERCTMEYSLSRLHARSLLLSSVELDGLVVVIEVDSSGAHDLPFPRQGGGGNGRMPLDIELARACIKRARVDYRDSAGVRASVSNLGLDLLAEDDGSYRYRVSVDSVVGGRESVGFELSGATAEGHITKQLQHAFVDASLYLPHIDISGFPARECTAELSYTGDSLFLRRADLLLADGSLSVFGSLSLDSLRELSLAVELASIDIPSLLHLVDDEVSPYEGAIDGRIEASGRLRDPASWEIDGELAVLGGVYRGRILDEFSGRIGLREEMLSIRVLQDYFEIEGEAALGGTELRGRFAARISDLGPVAALLGAGGVSGAVRIEGLLSGTRSDPVVTADIEARGIEYLGLPVDSLDGTILARGRSIELSGVTFSGKLDDVGTVDPVIRVPDLEGGFAYSGSAEGAVDKIKAAARVKLLEPSYRGVRFDGGLVAVEAEWPRIRIPVLELWSDSLALRGAGDMQVAERSGNLSVVLFGPLASDSTAVDDAGIDGMNETGRLECRFEMPAEEWRLRSRGIGIDMGWATSFMPDDPIVYGTLDFEMVAVGRPHPAVATLRLRAVEPFYAGASADSLKGIFSLEDGLLRADSIELFVRDDRMRFSASLGLAADERGRLSFDRKGTFIGSAAADSLDLDLLRPFLPEGADVRGSISLDLSWTGTIDRLLPTGRVTLVGGYGKIRPEHPLVERISLRASVKDSTFVIEKISGVIQDRSFTAAGKLTLDRWRKAVMDFRIDVEPGTLIRAAGSISPDSLGLAATIEQVDLALLSPYLPGFQEISGMLGVEVRVDGPPDGPRLEGHLDVRELVLQPDFMSEPFESGIVRLTFDRENIGVDSLLLRKGAGSVFVSGSILHDRGSLRAADLTVRADRLIFERKRSHLVSVDSAQLHYGNRGEQFLIDGDIILGETRVRADFKPKSIIPFARSIERPAKEPPEFMNRTNLDIRIRESDDVWIDNNIAKIRMRIDVGLIGTAVRPNLTGRISVAKGYILYIDRKFRIEEGTLDFIDPDRLNPIVALRASTRVTSYRAMEATPYTVTLSIAGPLDEASVDLASDPLLDRANIISLLTLGVTREQLTGAEEGGDVSARGVLMDRAKALTSERVGGYVSRNVEDLFQLDQVTIEGNLFDFGSSWGPQLLASKRISDRTTVTYKTNVGHLNERSILLDYRLTRGFSLSGETDQYGRSGIDLKYTIRLK